MSKTQQFRKNMIVHSGHHDLWEELRGFENPKQRAERFRELASLGAMMARGRFTMGAPVSPGAAAIIAGPTSFEADSHEGSSERDCFRMNIVVHSGQRDLWSELKEIANPKHQAERLRELASLGAMMARGRFAMTGSSAPVQTAEGQGPVSSAKKEEAGSEKQEDQNFDSINPEIAGFMTGMFDQTAGSLIKK